MQQILDGKSINRMQLVNLDTRAITPSSIMGLHKLKIQNGCKYTLEIAIRTRAEIGRRLRLREDCFGPGNEVGISHSLGTANKQQQQQSNLILGGQGVRIRFK